MSFMDEVGQISILAELIRKGIHLFALVIPIGYLIFPFPVAITGVLFAALISLIIDFSRIWRWPLWTWLSKIMGAIFREHEIKGGLSGATYILFTAAVTIVVFPKTIAVAALLFIVIGDTAAALVGRLIGRHRLVGKKSVEGSAACLFSLIIVSLLIPKLPILAGLAGATTATLAEMLSGKIDDNLTMPLVSAATMLIVMRMMGIEQAVLFAAIFPP